MDDKPSDDTAKKITEQFAPFVQYHRVDYGDPLESREYGFNNTESDYVCFLDADDVMDKNYLQSAVSEIITQKADLVYSDIYYFKDLGIGRTYLSKTDFHPEIPRKRISQTNFLHVGCVAKREIIANAYAFNHGTDAKDINYHEDWMFWRKVLSTGCKYVKQKCCYFARKHNNNRSRELQDKTNYYGLRGIDLSSLTYVGLIEKELQDLYCFTDWWNGAQNNRNGRLHVELFGCINYDLIQGSSPVSWHSPWAWHAYSDKRHVVNQIAKSAITDYVFFYHENNRPNFGKLQSMLKHLDHNVAMVHDKKFEPFECTLVVADVLRDYYYHDLERLPFGDNEKIVYL